MATITDNDKYVLNAIFNPNYPLDFDKDSSTDSTDSENESKSFLDITVRIVMLSFVYFYF
jgi:hypothetical protein